MNTKKAFNISIKVAIIIVIVVAFVLINDTINGKRAKMDNEGYQHQIESLVYDNATGEVKIKGWCIKEGVDCATVESRQNFKVFLAEDGDLDKVIEIPVTPSPRMSITTLYGKGINDYTYSGFSGSVIVDSSIEKKRYRVIIQLDSTVEKYFFTHRYLNKGVLTTEYYQYER